MDDNDDDDDDDDVDDDDYDDDDDDASEADAAASDEAEKEDAKDEDDEESTDSPSSSAAAITALTLRSKYTSRSAGTFGSCSKHGSICTSRVASGTDIMLDGRLTNRRICNRLGLTPLSSSSSSAAAAPVGWSSNLDLACAGGGALVR
jgi:hypothetical protein